jgi:hypothetical protein
VDRDDLRALASLGIRALIVSLAVVWAGLLAGSSVGIGWWAFNALKGG